MLRRTTSTSRANDPCRPVPATHGGRGEGGVALITTLLLVGLLSAVGLGLTMLTMVETWLGAGLRASQALRTRPMPGSIASRWIFRSRRIGRRRSWRRRLVEHPRSTMARRHRRSRTEARFNLAAETRRVQTASDSEYGDASANPDSPAWRLFAHGPVGDLIPGRAADSPFYLVAWIADDPSDGDRDPAADANGRLMIRATAFGSGGARRSVEATVARVGPPGFTGRPSAVSMVVWRELR